MQAYLARSPFGASWSQRICYGDGVLISLVHREEIICSNWPIYPACIHIHLAFRNHASASRLFDDDDACILSTASSNSHFPFVFISAHSLWSHCPSPIVCVMALLAYRQSQIDGHAFYRHCYVGQTLKESKCAPEPRLDSFK